MKTVRHPWKVADMQQIQTRDSESKVAIRKLQYDLANLMVDYFQLEAITYARHRLTGGFNTCSLT